MFRIYKCPQCEANTGFDMATLAVQKAFRFGFIKGCFVGGLIALGGVNILLSFG